MTVLESLSNTTDKATDKAEKYLKTSQEYVKLKVFQQLTLSLSLLMKLVVIGGLAILSVIFIAVSIAIVIGEELGNISLGYLIVGIGFLLIAILAYFFRNLMDKKVITSVSDKFFD